MNNDTINQRFITSINYVIDNKLIKNKTELSEKLDSSKSKFSEILNNRMNVSAQMLGKFSSLFGISLDWLITGEGEMLKNEIQAVKVKVPEKSKDNKYIPLVHQSAVAGFGSASFAISDQDIKDYYVVPKFKYNRIDFMIEISGSSMYPKYNSGDVVACTIIRESKFIQWNKCHIISTREQGILVKRLKKGDSADNILAISDNKDYDPFLIPVNEITGIALVVGVIRLE